MSLKSNIQRVVFNQALKKKTRQNQVKYHPFNLAKTKSFAFLLDISDGKPLYVQQAIAFAEKLRKRGKEVSLLAYTNAETRTEGQVFDCFCRKDLNWALVPKGDVVDAFLAKEYDVLINFYFEESKALDFITRTAAAHFRIGYYDEDRTDLYDLMVHNPTMDIDTMIRQIEYGMGIINT